MKKELHPDHIKKIAVLRALQLGDLLCGVPSFRALRKAYPDAQITLIGLPHQQDFAARFHDYIDNFIPFPGYPGLPEQEPDMELFPEFLKQVQDAQFDLVLQLQGSGLISNSLVTLFNGKITAGMYAQIAYKPNETYFFPYPEDGHEIHKLLYLLKNLGIPSAGDHLEFPITMEEKDHFAILAKAYGLKPFSYVCIHPGSRSEKRRWDIEKFAQIADTVADHGFKIVFTGTKSEELLIQQVQQEMNHPSSSLAGKMPLGVTAALLQQSRLLIANDTGVSHVASALSVPSIILFTGSEMARWAPVNKELHKMIDGTVKSSLEQVRMAMHEFLYRIHREREKALGFISI